MHTNQSLPEYDVIDHENIMVKMRDGVELATDLYFPAKDGKITEEKYPTLLCRTPYNKTQAEQDLGYGHWFARCGYVVILQDCRGCFKSNGSVNFLIPEAEDGFDTLQWIDRQRWSNGKVGSFGTSWCGWTQTAMAALGPKNLSTMIPNMSGSNAHTSSVRHGGALELRFLAWAFWHSAGNTQAQLKAEPSIDPALNLGAVPFRDWLRRMPIRRGQTQLRLVPPYEDWAFEILTHGDYDEYWRHPSYAPSEHWGNFPDIPVLFIGGWYDSYTRATFENYVGLSSQKTAPIKVMVGPWTHGTTTVEQSEAGNVEFGHDAALLSFRDLHQRWFDATLKGIGTIDDLPPVKIFTMGGGSGIRTGEDRLFHGGRWRNETEWPLAKVRYTRYYLHCDSALRTQPPRKSSAAITYRFDPSNPVPSIGGNVSSLIELDQMPTGIGDPAMTSYRSRREEIMVPGGFDQVEAPTFFGCEPPYLPLGSRSDILVFQTDPLTEDIEVTGPIAVMLWVSSSTVDTDFTAKLIDVYPPSRFYPFGYSLNLTDSIMRLRYRNGPENAKFLPPGEIGTVTITLYPTSNVFAAGHRIRLDISSSNFPRFDVNPNTGEPLGLNRRQVEADNTVHLDSQRPSHLILPIVPN